MIRLHAELGVAAWLRQEVMQALGGIEDASEFTRFNDPSPNWLTTDRLSGILSAYEDKLCALGAVRVVMHGDCEAKGHAAKAVANYRSSGYWRYILPDGQTDAELARDGVIYWHERPMTTVPNDAFDHATEATTPCPCGRLDRKYAHRMARYFLWPDTEETSMAGLCGLTNSLRDAIEACKERRPRSGIREHLLMTLVGLERLMQERSIEGILAERNVAITY